MNFLNFGGYYLSYPMQVARLIWHHLPQSSTFFIISASVAIIRTFLQSFNICHTLIAVTSRTLSVVSVSTLFMVALCNRADHYIFALWFLSFFLLPYKHTWCGLSANLRCRSETCCTRLAGNTGRKKVAKNRHLGTIAQLWRAISLQVRHVSTIGKKTC